MRPDRDPAWENGQEAAVHAGRYGLTPTDGQAPPACPTGSQVPGGAWPVRAALVPPLADGFITRPETVPGLEAALIPETGSPGAACWPTPSAWPPSGRSCPSRTTPARWSRRSAARTYPGWSAGSPRLSSACSWSPLSPGTSRHDRPIAATARQSPPVLAARRAGRVQGASACQPGPSSSMLSLERSSRRSHQVTSCRAPRRVRRNPAGLRLGQFAGQGRPRVPGSFTPSARLP